MKIWLKTGLYLCAMLSVTFVCPLCFAQRASQNWANRPQNWQNNPNNWQNSPDNWQNSPDNWQNSPQNWQNNPDNFNVTNGIYDSDGRHIGYGVPTPNGGVNYFNNDGTRRAYQPGH